MALGVSSSLRFAHCMLGILKGKPFPCTDLNAKVPVDSPLKYPCDLFWPYYDHSPNEEHGLLCPSFHHVVRVFAVVLLGMLHKLRKQAFNECTWNRTLPVAELLLQHLAQAVEAEQNRPGIGQVQG